MAITSATTISKSSTSAAAVAAVSSLPIIVVVVKSVVAAGLLSFLYRVLLEAYKIRVYSIVEFGPVIHEFDPYFNYRATEYLYEHGWYKFRSWFDYMVWYPLGRPIGTTIYPGMQVTTVFIKNRILPHMSINDICCYIPAWFGVTATLGVAWLTYECTREASSSSTFNCILNNIPGVQQIHQSLLKPVVAMTMSMLKSITGATNALGLQTTRPQSALTAPSCAVAAAAFMSVVPAHLVRSIGGKYDNESIATTAMVLTFACWTFSLRDGVAVWQTISAAVLTGLAYFFMVATWGGYVFVVNIIGVHAVVLVLLGCYSTKLHRCYSIFYVVGTALAMQVPVVSMTPLKSLEQLGPCLAFLCFQLIEFCEYQKRLKNLTVKQTWKLRVSVFTAASVLGVLTAAILAQMGYFGPVSSRVRGLFVKHTKTGNPLVDSVAEHQVASPEVYFNNLHLLLYLVPVAWAVTALFFFNDASSFLLVYGVAAHFFSQRMIRLILLTAPVASALGGICIGRVGVWMLQGSLELLQGLVGSDDNDQEADTTDEIDSSESSTAKGKKASGARKNTKAGGKKRKDVPTKEAPSKLFATIRILILVVRLVVSVYAVMQALPYFYEFHIKAHAIAKQISNPTIMYKARTYAGKEVIVDDYRDAYFWLRDNTPEDARIMAWWDYGYQITGIANRTTLADGNTWNHEHIALLGRMLTASEKEALRIARHLADYVLVWSGGGKDDVAKSAHMRRIANSVYRGLCSEPTCRDFGFNSTDRTPTPDMANSLVYKLHSNSKVPGVEVDRNLFQEVFTSKYFKVRIYKIQSVSQESKEWVANNRVCDAPGSWFCRGQYPPALEKILEEKTDFKQLEDFNQNEGDDSEYQRKYFENLNHVDGPWEDM